MRMRMSKQEGKTKRKRGGGGGGETPLEEQRYYYRGGTRRRSVAVDVEGRRGDQAAGRVRRGW